MTPEAIARQKIDAMLVACGWVVQDYAGVDLSAGVGVALREVPLTGGRCDYLLIVGRVPVGIVEAKRAETTLSGGGGAVRGVCTGVAGVSARAAAGWGGTAAISV